MFWDLLRTADVFVDGFLAGACDALGIGYERQREFKPDIVYCHCSGFGATGPYARVPTHGQMMNALAASVPLATGDDGLVRERRVDRSRWAAPRSAATAPRPERSTPRSTSSPPWCAGRVTGQGCYLDAAGSDGVIAQGWIGATYGLNQRPDHRPHRPAPPGRHRADEREVQLLRGGRRSLRAVLCDRAQVLEPLLRRGRASRISPAEQRRRPRRSTSPTATSRCAASCRASSPPAPRRSGSPSPASTACPSGRPTSGWPSCATTRRSLPARSSSKVNTPQPARSPTSASRSSSTASRTASAVLLPPSGAHRRAARRARAQRRRHRKLRDEGVI